MIRYAFSYVIEGRHRSSVTLKWECDAGGPGAARLKFWCMIAGRGIAKQDCIIESVEKRS